MTTKYCVECRYARLTYNNGIHRCTHADAVGPRDIVTGEFGLPPQCSTMRLNESRCGQEAKWFEPITAPREQPQPPLEPGLVYGVTGSLVEPKLLSRIAAWFGFKK